VSEQAILNSGVLIVKADTGSDSLAALIFAVLMIARAPLQLFQSVSTSILPHLTSLHTSDDPESDREFGHTVKMVLLGIVAFTGVALVFMALVGPKAMQIAFGDKFTYDRAGLLIVTAGMGFYLASGTLNQAALAQGQARASAVRWVVCAAGFIAWNLIPVFDEFRRVEVGFAGAAALLCTLLFLLYRRPPKVPRPEDVVEPGSPREIEAQLAAADEAS
jgi:O-antigen/teichoic acid export membrane protein